MWVKIISWHYLVGSKTLCGRKPTVPSPTADDLPMGEKSCETCLRVKRHKDDNS